MNVAVSNVPGPRERGHIGGAPVSEIYSVGVLSPGSAFNMTVWSYVDQLDIAVLPTIAPSRIRTSRPTRWSMHSAKSGGRAGPWRRRP